ncbi:MAG: rod shape-determining protein MreD [Dysgonamonadaceae bacterium]|jgi:rod shape-determining protein MreD|nr:rod shape-determining protein MreD [Dysgonamonadaceae bacterium]
MSANWLKYALFFFLVVLLQIWILNRVHLFGFATPLFYVYFILKLPGEMKRTSLLFTACLLGLVVDFFSYSLGLNMLACTIMAFSRHYVFNTDIADSFVPSIETFGFPSFMRYAIILVVIHHIVFFVAESFTFLDPLTLSLKIAGSSILTVLLILGTEQLKLNFLKK